MTGTLTLTGASGNDIVLRSTSNGSQWLINPTASSVSFVDVEDSDNINATAIVPSASTNSTNNTNWTFLTSYFWVGGTANWSNANAASWSLSSGGAGGAGVPGAANIVIFDSNSGGGTVTVTSATTITNLDINGYSGTITLSANVGVTGTFSQNAGTYNGNGQTTTVTGLTEVSGGIYGWLSRTEL